MINWIKNIKYPQFADGIIEEGEKEVWAFSAYELTNKKFGLVIIDSRRKDKGKDVEFDTKDELKAYAEKYYQDNRKNFLERGLFVKE